MWLTDLGMSRTLAELVLSPTAPFPVNSASIACANWRITDPGCSWHLTGE